MSIQEKSKIYITHDNGYRPYLVDVNSTRVNISINKTKKILGIIPLDDIDFIFIGISENMKWSEGNSVLLKCKNNRYIFIGHIIYEFTTNKDDIISYYSYVGNNNVPYPVAVGKNNYYFMLEQEYVNKKEFPKNINIEKDAYGLYYRDYRQKTPLTFSNFFINLENLFMKRINLEIYSFEKCKIISY